MSFQKAKLSFPDAKVLVGYDEAYSKNKTINKKTSYKSGHLIYGCVNSTSKPDEIVIVNFNTLEGVGIIQSQDLLIAYHEDYSFITSFKIPSGVNFTSSGEFPNILIDNNGNYWDVFGTKVTDNKLDIRLEPTNSYLGLWWAWRDFFIFYKFFDV